MLKKVKKLLNKNAVVLAIALLALTLVFTFSLPVFAAINSNTFFAGTNGANNTASALGLGNADLITTVLNIIRIVMGFLGLLAVILIIYAGFLWMTAAGEADRIERAKKVLIGALIGLLLVIFSFAIVTFVLNTLTTATGGNGDGSVCDPACVAPQVCCNSSCQAGPCSHVIPPGPGSFTASVHPSGEWSVPLNGVGWIKFSDQVKLGSGSFAVTKVDAPGSTTPGTDLITEIVTKPNGNKIEYESIQTCAVVKDAFPAAGIIIPAGHEHDQCFKPDVIKNNNSYDGNGYRVQISGYQSTSNVSLSCFGNSCVTDFSASPTLDVTPPTIAFSYRNMCINMNNTLSAWVGDDWGVQEVGFYVDNVFITPTSTPAIPVRNYNAQAVTNAITTLGDHQVKIIALDIANNVAILDKTVKAWPSHCCNGVKDVDETGVDCGGSCGVCDGAACAKDMTVPATCSDNLCASQFCAPQNYGTTKCEDAGYVAGTTVCCLCQRPPVITGVFPVGGFCRNEKVNPPVNTNTACLDNKSCTAPAICNRDIPNGAEGNLVTIIGQNFGPYVSGKSEVSINGKSADLAITTNPECTNSWQDDQIIAVVPTVASSTGLVKVTTSSGFSDDTSLNPALPNFLINTISRPGLCQLTPDKGVMNTSLTYYGINLNGSTAYFGNTQDIKAVNSSFTAGTQGTAQVPNIQTGRTTTFVADANIFSNYLSFNKLAEPYTGPFISSFIATSGPVGTYVTIRGQGFGASRGKSEVYFGTTTASYDFPKICADSIWSDKQVIVKVPSSLSPGSFVIKMQIGTWVIDTSKLTPSAFTVNLDPLAPGLCKINPIIGKVDSEVSLWGEYFGPKSTAKIQFYLNKYSNIGLWGKEAGADKATTTVPLGAITGPVRVTQGPLASNGFNFTVGVCKKMMTVAVPIMTFAVLAARLMPAYVKLINMEQKIFKKLVFLNINLPSTNGILALVLVQAIPVITAPKTDIAI